MIRKALESDLESCSKLICQVVAEVESRYYSPHVIKAWQELNSPENLIKEAKSTEFYLCEEDKRLLGVGALKEAHIVKVYVLPSSHGRGIGRSLVETIEGVARNHGYKECDLNSSINAVNFYKHLGYQEQESHTIERDGISVTFTRMTKQI